MSEQVDPEVGLAFPRAARLDLDEQLDQLVARAREVQETQGRLRALLRAYLAVARSGDLDTVLRQVVEAARELVNARYAALGVVAGGRLKRFLHVGMPEDVAALIPHPPEGKGLLGLLVDYPQTLRLPNIAGHVAAVGFPDNHPSMISLLGVPIRVGDRVFGNLYLTEKEGAPEFTADDEELVQALAAAAAIAIENATLLADSSRRQAWQAAMTDVTTALLAGDDPDEALKRLVHHARELLDAAGVGVNVPTDDVAIWRVAVTEGLFERWNDVTVPLEGSATGLAVSAGDVVIIDDPAADDRTVTTAERAIGLVGQTLAAPLRSERGIIGVLVASRRPGERGFDDLDKEMTRAVASHAGLALELADARRAAERLRLVEDRAEIADDLRHRVIQRLFALGLNLQGAASRMGKSDSRSAIESQIDEVDAIIREVRAAVFSLRPATSDLEPGESE